MSNSQQTYCDRVSRRNLIKAGLAGAVGLSLPDILRLQAESAERGQARRDTAIIYIEMAGGPTQHETYDPKPDAPAEYRGPLNSIDTALPGVQFSQYMTEQAKIADKLAVIRSIHHRSSSHGTSSHLTQTGYYLRDRQNRDNDMPCFGSITSHVRGAHKPGMPAFVSLPREMRYGRAGWLGKGYNAFVTGRDANSKKFQVPNLTLMRGLTAARLGDRRQLLTDFDATRRLIDNKGTVDAIDDFTHQAFDMITGDAARNAFDISREDQKTRERYGMNATGQNVLLARRLVERGVSVATIRTGSWDDHGKIADRMKSKGPSFDQAVAGLVTDLYERGLDKKVMLVCMGEFGRTPRINRGAGRDHWGSVMSVLLAGGGLPVGQIIGASDSKGSVPKERPYRPEDVLHTMYAHLGIDPALTFADNSGRPRAVLERRNPIIELA
ncbi:MAG: DUF1501 domain-containing protein [Planctomycetaceae bacterium]|nr:DUF1501 domain-containing protein [Planctomycetaceae bacterium]MBT6156449.1 DUF1501 domain-containing protein [Planctomycetaceae bacterium]MBT6485473.1 DUF1501 domain-containing protein [Planctomycetaceae bacterium]MBT6497269.1 DUF1501 domain-containing protein [Planctomycetaceae bacterium]